MRPHWLREDCRTDSKTYSIREMAVWEIYPAFEWERGDHDSQDLGAQPRALNVSRAALARAQQNATAALGLLIAANNGSYPQGAPAARACESLVRGLAPRGLSLPHGSAASSPRVHAMCDSARGTLAASLIQHHIRTLRPRSPYANITAHCQRYTIGVKACVSRSRSTTLWVVPSLSSCSLTQRSPCPKPRSQTVTSQ